MPLIYKQFKTNKSYKRTEQMFDGYRKSKTNLLI